jgi:septal ring factor EnvC (AmiA/AmiB activator)
MMLRSIRALAIAFALIVPAAAAPAPQTANGVPASQAGKLPSSHERYQSLQQQIQKTKPGVEQAKRKSAALRAQAQSLKEKLIATVARVQSLERQKTTLDTQIAKIETRERAASARFAKDRVRVGYLLGLLERVQSDYPPPIALEPEDALKASRGAMVLGASLPPLYSAAATLARQIESLDAMRNDLAQHREQAARNLAQLASARRDLDQLVARRSAEAVAANHTYRALQATLDQISRQAGDLKTLLDRVAALRSSSGGGGMVVVTAANNQEKTKHSGPRLLRPVNGQIVPGGPGQGATMPGLTFAAPAGAAVVAPADSRVLFAGPYHKTGQVLILELTGGYDLVLAGLDRLTVRPGDELLAGEPVGRMAVASGPRLYLELRQDGKDVNPAPWLGMDLRKAKKS